MNGIGKVEMIVPETTIDTNRHVNNVHYIQWMQDAALAHSAALGWPQERYMNIGQTWIIRSHSIEYLQPTYAGDAISIFTWITSMQKIRCLRKFKFFRPLDNITLATAATQFVFCDIETGKPLPIPREVQNAYPIISKEEEP